MAAYALGFASLSVLRQQAFNTGRFDLGNMVQAVWATAHGHPLAITDLHGDQISRLAAHVDPILILFAPLWWIWPSPDMLLTVQAVAVALGALPVYRLARKHLDSPRAGLAFGLVYLLLPSVQWLTLNEFHPVALATPLLLYAFWYLDDDRLPPFVAFALLAMTTKEQIPLVVAAMGLWYAISRRSWRTGGAIALIGLAWTTLALEVIVPHFNSGAGSAFYSRYQDVGGTPGGVVSKSVTDPGRVLGKFFGHRGLHYLWQMASPEGFLWAFAPLAILVALPELLLNLLSSTATQTSIHFHYTAGAIPALVAASVLGAGRLARRGVSPAVLGGFALVVVVASNYNLGAIPLWRLVPGGERYQGYAARVTEHDRISAQALKLIPPGVVVSAGNGFGAHLSDRRRILSFPFVQDATWVIADELQPSYADRVADTPAATQLAWLRGNPDWRLVFSQQGVLVFHRVEPP